MKSTAAVAAKAIRAEIKSKLPGLQFKCTSKVYSMGCSVSVAVRNQPKETLEKIYAIIDKYAYGSFDGMTDCYEYNNRNDRLPQVKYVFCNNERA